MPAVVPKRASDMRVLVVTNLWPSPHRPAYGTFIRSQVESLVGVDVETEVLVIEGKRSRSAYADAVAEVRRRVRSGRFDVVHAHYGYSGWVALCQRRLPVVISFLGDDIQGTFLEDGKLHWKSRVIAAVNRRTARGAGAVIVKTEAMRRRLGMPGAHVIPNGVDLDLFRPLDRTQARQKLALPPDRTLVLFAGDPDVAVKRHPLALAAVEKLARKRDIDLLVARGRPQEEMPLWFNAANALLLASRSEGSPNVVKEAMACNLPVVATDVGDVAWLLERSPGNRVVPATVEPESALADLLARALDDVVESGRTTGRDAMAELSLPAVARRIREVYTSVIPAGVGETG